MQSSRRLRVIIAGGGTGGHLYPGLALAEEFERRHKAEIMFIGTSYGIENRVLPTTSYAFKRIWMRGLHRGKVWSNLLFPVRMKISLLQSCAHLLKFKPQVVIGTGGYVAGPVLMAALILKVPTVIQEQNSYPGLVNRLLGNRVDQVHVTYEASLPYFQKAGAVFVSGNPVRSRLKQVDRGAALEKFGLREDRVTLLIFGGSQGARAINRSVLDSVPELREYARLQVLWVTGPVEFEAIREQCRAYGDRIRLHPFIDDMASAYAAADMVLCRAGASTLSEITLCGLPSILVPYPYAAGGHQDFNAKTLEKAGAAIRLPEESLAENGLTAVIRDLVDHPEKRNSMAKAALALAKPKATSDIVDKIEAMIQRGKRA